MSSDKETYDGCDASEEAADDVSAFFVFCQSFGAIAREYEEGTDEQDSYDFHGSSYQNT